MKKLIAPLAALLLSIALSSCYNSQNEENIIGKWKGVYTENCASAIRTSSVEIEFTADKKFTAIITPPDSKPAMTTGTYHVERYRLIFINNRKERDIQKIETLSEVQYEGSFSNERCSGTTKLRKENH
jgi:hypothetical protein